MEQQTKCRADDIDIAKGLGMLAVMWGHLMLGGRSNSFVYGFHIPLFFFLSGMVFRPEKYPTVGSLFRRRCKTLLLPYAMFSLITWVYWVLRRLVLSEPLHNAFRPLLQTLLAQGSGGFLSHNVALWFVTCLFATEMLYYGLRRLPKGLLAPAVLLCGAIGYFLVQPNGFFDFTLLPWSLESAFTAVVFYALGAAFAESPGREALSGRVREHRLLSAALALALFAAVFLLAGRNGRVSLGHAVLGDSILVFYLAALAGILATLLISAVFADGTAPLTRYLRWLGRNSFYAMAIHVPVMVDLVWLAARLGGADRDALRYSYAYTLPILAGMLLVTSLWMLLVIKIKQKDEKMCEKRKSARSR